MEWEDDPNGVYGIGFGRGRNRLTNRCDGGIELLCLDILVKRTAI